MDDSNEQKPLGPDDSSLETPPSGLAGMPEGPQAQPVANPSVPTPEQPVPRKKLAGWKLWALITAGALLLLGGGAFAYFGYYLPNQPKNVIGKAMQNLLSAQSLSFSGSAASGQDEFDLEFSGAGDTGFSAFWLDAQLSYSSTTVEAKLRGADSKLYFNLKGLVDSSSIITSLLGGGQGADDLGLGLGISQILSAIEDTWFELDTTEATPVTVDDSGVSGADKEKISDILSEYQLFDIEETLETRDINERSAKGYQVAVNINQLEQALKEFADTEFESIEPDDSIGETITNGFAELESESVEDYSLQLWVYDDDKTMARVNLEVEDDSGSFAYSLVFDNYNQPVNVEIPEEATPVDELLGSLFAF